MAESTTRTRRKSPKAGGAVHIVQSTPPSPTEVLTKTPVIFIHGLWLHASSWQRWVEHFNAAGYDASAPGWPDFPDDIERARQHPEFMFDQTINEVVDHYQNLIRLLPTKPVIIGHSFGGLIAQLLLDKGSAAAAVAIAPAPIHGVLLVPFAQLKASWPVLGNPLRMHHAVGLKPSQFRYAFANKLTEAEAIDLYYQWTIPAPSKPLWQTAFASLNPWAENKVDTRRDRPPLLLMAGRHDHTVPLTTTRIVHRLYRNSPAVTELKEWPNRGHSLTIDNGWQELADYIVEWLEVNRIRPRIVSN